MYFGKSLNSKQSFINGINTNYLLEKDLVDLIKFHWYNKFHYMSESGDISEIR